VDFSGRRNSSRLAIDVILISLGYFKFVPQTFCRSKYRTVANNKSALKRAQIAERNRLRNKAYKSAVKTLMKNYFAALQTYAANPNTEGMQEVQTRMSAAYSKIDRAVKRGVLHRNNGAHKKSRLAQALKKLQVQAEAS
jgi:small subunit ribosomal protein S20